MLKKTICIYSIVNLRNHKQYIGSTSNLYKRKDAHFYKLRKGIHPNLHLQMSFDKYGQENFIFQIIEVLDSPSLLEDREQFWLDGAKKQGIILYNIRPLAKNNTGLFIGKKNPFYGKTHSKKFSLEQSERMTKNPIQKLGKQNSFYGKHHTKEFIDYMKQRMSGKNNPRFGKRKKYCPKGHRRTTENLNTSYGCKICARLSNKIYNANRKRR